MLDANTLPNDVPTLKRLVVERDREVEHLKLQLAKLRRWKFGQSSEQLKEAGQLPLTLEELKAVVIQAVLENAVNSEPQPAGQGRSDPPKTRPVRRKRLPEHFETIENVIEPQECVCADCGGELKQLGKPDEAEVLEAKTVTFTVTRHIRPKKRCCSCARIVQAPAPSRPIEKSFAGASLLALVITWKYGFHLPLYRIWTRVHIRYYESAKNMGESDGFSHFCGEPRRIQVCSRTTTVPTLIEQIQLVRENRLFGPLHGERK